MLMDEVAQASHLQWSNFNLWFDKNAVRPALYFCIATLNCDGYLSAPIITKVIQLHKSGLTDGEEIDFVFFTIK